MRITNLALRRAAGGMPRALRALLHALLRVSPELRLVGRRVGHDGVRSGPAEPAVEKFKRVLAVTPEQQDCGTHLKQASFHTPSNMRDTSSTFCTPHAPHPPTIGRRPHNFSFFSHTFTYTLPSLPSPDNVRAPCWGLACVPGLPSAACVFCRLITRRSLPKNILAKHRSATMPNPVVYFDVAASGQPLGRIEMEVGVQEKKWSDRSRACVTGDGQLNAGEPARQRWHGRACTGGCARSNAPISAALGGRRGCRASGAAKGMCTEPTVPTRSPAAAGRPDPILPIPLLPTAARRRGAQDGRELPRAVHR